MLGYTEFRTKEDVEKTIPIVKDELEKHGIVMNKRDLYQLTMDIMSISYSKGGGYSDYEIRAYAKSYITRDMYKIFISKK